MNRLTRIAGRLPGAVGLLLLIALPCGPGSAQPAERFAGLVQQLNTGGYRDKEQVVEELAELDHPRVVIVLEAMMEGDLRIADDRPGLVITEKAEGGYAMEDAVTGESLGVAGRRDVKRVRTNNALRSALRDTLSMLRLGHDDPDVRLAAAERLIGELGLEDVTTIRRLLKDEDHAGVRHAMKAAVAIADLHSDDAGVVSEAIGVLSGSLHSQVRGALQRVVDNHDDPQLRQQADAALRSIQSRLDFYAFLETLFFGLSLGSILALAAIGLAITFGVMGVINMAHGELIMLGAYTTYGVQRLFPDHIGLSLLMAVPAAFVVSGGVGVVIERGVIRFLYGRPLETLLATFGISLILQQVVRTFVSAQNVAVTTPEWMSGSWQINPVFSLTFNRLYVLLFAIFVFAALMLLLKRSSLGLQVRAVSQNPEAAWYFIQWALSKENQVGAILDGVPSARASSWANEEFQQTAPRSWIEASQTSFDRGQPDWNPPVVPVPEVRDAYGQAISSALQGADVGPALEQANEEIERILERED
jgi:urea transport system permease protein